MKYLFKKFEGTNIRLERRITITRTKSIGFPTKFSEENNIKSYKYAVLFFDDSIKAIGIQFTNSEEEKNKFSIIKSNKYGASIIAQSFFKSKNIDLEKYHGRYEWKLVDQEGVGKLFVIELNNPKLDKNN